MPNNLIDNEIKKALECCSENAPCSECPMWERGPNCVDGLYRYALNLINRLQAENERLSKITRPLIAEIKAEAMTEFAEELKEKSFKTYDWRGMVKVVDIDNLLKEIVGEDNLDQFDKQKKV